MADPMEIAYLPLSELIRAPRNPKDHDLGAIHESFKRFGYVSPIIVEKSTGTIVAGHGRLDTLEQMKGAGKEAPQRIREQNGEWMIPVVTGIDLETPEGAEAYLIADNRLVLLGGWNESNLADMLQEIAKEGTLEGIGFDQEDLDRMIADHGDREPTGDTAGLGDVEMTIRLSRDKLTEEIKEYMNDLAQQWGGRYIFRGGS